MTRKGHLIPGALLVVAILARKFFRVSVFEHRLELDTARPIQLLIEGGVIPLALAMGL